MLFFDELDMLVAANPDVKIDFLAFVRALKQRQEPVPVDMRSVRAVVGIGSYEVLMLADTVVRGGGGDAARGAVRIASPFNVSDDFKEQHFQCEELAVVVQAYATEHGVELPQHFTEDLFASTHGYVRPIDRSTMVCESLERTSGFSYIWRQLDRNLRGR